MESDSGGRGVYRVMMCSVARSIACSANNDDKSRKDNSNKAHAVDDDRPELDLIEKPLFLTRIREGDERVW